jgi:hypothetical protein
VSQTKTDEDEDEDEDEEGASLMKKTHGCDEVWMSLYCLWGGHNG